MIGRFSSAPRPSVQSGIRPVALATLLLTIGSRAFADGTETLGAPVAFPIAAGSGLLVAGTGLDVQPGTIAFNVPAAAAVKQVVLYWEGEHTIPTPGDDTIVVDGNLVSGALIGGPTVFFFDVQTTSFRADITGLGLVGPGANSLTVQGLTNNFSDSGAGVLVIFDEGPDSEIGVRDGNDNAFVNFAPPLDATVPQSFGFASSTSDRTARLGLFAGSVGCERPNRIDVTVGAVTTSLCDFLGGPGCPPPAGSEFWDAINLDVAVPAGVTSLTVQIFSGTGGPCPLSATLPASLNWVCAALSVPAGPAGEGCTPGYWKNHLGSWAPTGYTPDQSVVSVFAGAAAFPGLATKSLKQALAFGGGSGLSGKAKILLRAAVAAVLNASHPSVDYPMSVADIVSQVNEALASGSQSQMTSLASMLDADNNLGCPLN